MGILQQMTLFAPSVMRTVVMMLLVVAAVVIVYLVVTGKIYQALDVSMTFRAGQGTMARVAPPSDCGAPPVRQGRGILHRGRQTRGWRTVVSRPARRVRILVLSAKRRGSGL